MEIVKKLTGVLTAAVILTSQIPAPISAGSASAEDVWKPNPVNAWEKLDRGLVAMQTEDGVYLTWRLQSDEDNVYGTGSKNVSFDIYRDGEKIAVESRTTNYIDVNGKADSEYIVVKSGAGISGEKSVTPFSSGSNYFEIPLDVPAPVSFPSDNAETEEEETEDGTTETGGEEGGEEVVVDGRHAYTVGDSSTGDLDGDGELEIVVKWDCSPKDNSHNGYTGNVILSAYKFDGTHMWDIDLGPNIRSGAHYTQFLVYDFDGDGIAEITAKTAPGSKGADGEYVTKAAKTDADILAVTDDENAISYVSGAGRILTGDEYFTIFDGKTGNALDTIYYPNQRLAPSIWGDSDTYGNRVDRFNATVAYLDGSRPYAVYMRGYYYGYGGQRQAACAISFDGEKLECTHSFDTYDVNNYKDPSGYTTSSFRKKPYSARNYKGVIGYEEKYKEYVAQGNHNVSVADVDCDGRDEVLTGAMCYHFDENDNLRPLWSTFKGHGDAMHIGDYDPTHDGYEYFVVHEEGGGHYDHGTLLDYGMSVIDPGVPTFGETGKAPDDIIMFHKGNSGDTGRGVMANVGSGGYYQFWGAGTRMSAGGTDFKNAVIPGASSNFRIYWTGDLYEDLLDNIGISSWDENRLEMRNVLKADGCISVNGTKAVPALSADLFGDWREEVVLPTSDNKALRVYTTNYYTEYKMKSLMYDNVYRCGVSAEQSGYNQPPHIGYYLDPGDNGEGKVDTVPKVSLPAGAQVIIHQDAESSAVSSYYNSLPEDIDGFNIVIGGIPDKVDRTKYFAVVNQGLTNNVFKMQNGDYSTSNRAVVVDFTDEVKQAASAANEDGKYTELTFAFKLFDGTDGTTGELQFIKDRTGNRYSTEYANKIAAVSTGSIAEGEWGIVRYEFTPDGAYNIYLNDIKMASGTTDTAVPMLAMPFTNLSGNAPHTSMIFDDLYIYSIASEAAPTPAPTAEPEPTEKPLGAAPAKTDSIMFEDFEGEMYKFTGGTVTTDPATLSKNETKVLDIVKSSATSKELSGANKTKTYVKMDFRIDAAYYNKTAAVCLRGGSNDIINISSLPGSNGRWGTLTLNGEDVKTALKASSDSYGGWRDTTGWVTLYAALDFTEKKAEVSLARTADGSVLYSDTLDFYKDASALDYIYSSTAATGGGIWLDNIDVSVDTEASLTGLTLTSPDKTVYFTGEEFLADGLTVTANYDDNTSYSLTPFEYEVSEPDMSSAGEKTVTVIYGGVEETFSITVKDKEIASLSVLSEPYKTRYAVGEDLNTLGLVLGAVYDDGSMDTVTDGYTLTGFGAMETGTKTVTAHYLGEDATFEVEVVAADEVNPTPTPKPTARPVPTAKPVATENPDEPETTDEPKNKVYSLDVTGLSTGDVSVRVTSPADRANADVADYGDGTEYTGAIPALDGWGYRHATYSGDVSSGGRQTAAAVNKDENAFYACGDSTCSGGTVSFIPANRDDLSLSAEGIEVYEFDAVAVTTAQNKSASMPIGFTSSSDGARVAAVDSVSLSSTGVNNEQTTYKMLLVNDKKNGKYYIYQDGILKKSGSSDAITGIYAQTVSKYAKIGFKDLKLCEQTALPVAVKVTFNGYNGKALSEYSSVLAGTLLEAPEAPIVAGKTFKEWRDKDGNAATVFKAGNKTTVYNAFYEEGSIIASVYAFADRFAKITLTPDVGNDIVGHADIYGIATFENISKGVYTYKIAKEGYTDETGTFTLPDEGYDLESALSYDSSHTGYLYYEADWTNNAGYMTDGSAGGFSTDLGAVNVKLPTTDKIADVFNVTVKAKAENLSEDGAAATWLLNSDKGMLLGLHWEKDDGVYAITGWDGSSVPKNSTDLIGKAHNTLKIAEVEKLTDELTVNFAVDSVSGTIVVTADDVVVGSIPMVNGALSLNTMSAGVTKSADDIYVYSVAVTLPEDNYMAIAGDRAVAKISGAEVTRQYERSEANVTEGEEFTWSLTAPEGAAAGAVTLDQNGLLTVRDNATAGVYTISCQSKTNAAKKAETTVSVEGFQSLTLEADGPELCDFLRTDEIRYTIKSASDALGADVLDKMPSPVWSVSDTKIAKIDAETGVLTMVQPGTVTVTATVDNGGIISETEIVLRIVDYYIVAEATQNSTVINLSSLIDENVSAYRVTTASASGEMKKQFTVLKENVTADTLTIDTAGADNVEIAPVFSVSSGIKANEDDRYTFNIPAASYDITVTASGQRVDVYANNQLLVNNMLQHGSSAATETRKDIKISENYLTIKTSDYASASVNASWTKVSEITVVKSPEIAARKPKVYVLGDSLVAKYYNGGSAENPLARSGWGQVIENYLLDVVDVVPLGNSGVTAKGLYGTAFTQVRESAVEGDYLLLESGYNDKTYCTKQEMHDAVCGMYSEAAAKGVKVIFISPNASSHDYKASVAWSGYMREFAEETGAEYIDLAALSYSFLSETYGGNFSDYSAYYNVDDALHSTYNGAQKWASVVAQGIYDLGHTDIVNMDYEYTFSDGTENEVTAKVYPKEPEIPEVTSPVGKSGLVFTDDEQTLIETPAHTTGGTIDYSMDGENWYADTDDIAAVDAGDYDIYYRVTGDGEYASVEPQKITVTIEKAQKTAPSGLEAVSATSEKGADGSITGVTREMEYRLRGKGEFKNVTGATLTGLAAGEYEVRYAESDNYKAGEVSIVNVGCTITGTLTWRYAYSYTTGNGSVQTGIVPSSADQRSYTARAELVNRGEVYKTVTVTASETDGNNASGTYTFNDIPVSVNGVESSYTIKITPLVSENAIDTEQTVEAQSYTATFTDEANRNADISYNPYCFDAVWTVNIASADETEGAAPDTVYVKVLYGTTASGAEGSTYDGYAVITQQLSGNGTACALTRNADGSYTASGSYPVWKSQPDGGSYFHKVIAVGYTVNGTYIDCTSKNYISSGYMLYDDVNDRADKTMTISIDNMDVPLVVFDANGGETENGYILGNAYGATIPESEISANIPAWENHTFEGWYNAESGGTAVTVIPALSGKTILYAYWKANQSAPVGIDTRKASSATAKDGGLIGVDDTMEYSVDGGESWISVAEDEDTAWGLAAGEILVRHAATANKNAGEAVTVTIGIKADQTAPKGISVTPAESEKSKDGVISGLTDKMEYRKYGSASFDDITDESLTGLAAGEYEIRYKGGDDYNAGEIAVVSVGYNIRGNITWHYDYSYYPSGGGELHEGFVPNTISQRSRTARAELVSKGEVYRYVTVNASEVKNDSASGAYVFINVPATVRGESVSYTVKVTPLVAARDTDAVQAQEATSYSVTSAGGDNLDADVYYNPNCFDAEWTVNIGAITPQSGVTVENVYVKVLYGTTPDGAEGGTYDGYAVITQQETGNGTACQLVKNADGTYTAKGSYPVWKYQPSGGSYYHKAIMTGYTADGVYVDCTSSKYISDGYMVHDTETDKADRDMVITIESLALPVEPTAAPTTAPTTSATTVPTTEPTAAPTTAPTAAPTTAPTTAPTAEPTTAPTTEPITEPTAAPTSLPETEHMITELTLEHVSAVGGEGILMVAGYDENGTLIKLVIIDGLDGDIRGFEECYTIKAFLWESITSMKPFDSKTVNNFIDKEI